MNVYTVLWPNDYCQYIEAKTDLVGQPLTFLWGGHNRQTDYLFYKVQGGDILIPIRVYQGCLYIIADMKVKRIVHPDEDVLFSLQKRDLILNPCVKQIVEGENGTLIRFDCTVSCQQLNNLKFQSTRGERGVKHIRDGKLTNVSSFQGVYRLTGNSAALLLDIAHIA